MTEKLDADTHAPTHRPDPAPFAIGVAFALIVSVNLVALAYNDHTTTVLTKILIVPALIALLVAMSKGARPRLFWSMVAGLVFSWLGDAVPEFLADGFLVMVGFFACAQISYVVGFWPYREQSLVKRSIMLAPYAIAAVAVIALCVPHAGALFLPVIVYAALLMSTAVLSTGLGVVAGIGGALFLVSDGMIAIREFPNWGWTQHLDVPVMATYAIAQLLLVIGAASKIEADGPSAG